MKCHIYDEAIYLFVNIVHLEYIYIDCNHLNMDLKRETVFVLFLWSQSKKKIQIKAEKDASRDI